MPDTFQIVFHGAVGAEVAGVGHVEQGLAVPFELIGVEGLDLRLDAHVGGEVGQGHEPVLGQPVGHERGVGVAVAVGEGAVGHQIDGLLQARIGLVVGGGIVAFGVLLLDLVDGHAEQEEVLGADALTDLDVRAVQRTHGQGAVQSELHVAGTGSFLAGLGDLLVKLGGRDEVLSHLDVVVRQHVDGELALDGRIAADHAGNVVDQLDGHLGQVVARSSLGTEEHGARSDVLGLDLAGLDVGVVGDHGENLQRLALVLVQTLDHGVEQGVLVDIDAVVVLGEAHECVLVGLLDGGELLDEFIVLGQRLETLEQFQIGDPLVGAQALGDEVGQARVGELDEATRGHAVGHVGELVRVDVGEVLEGDVLQQLGVQLGHAVDVGAAVGGQVGHAHGVASVDGHVLDGVGGNALGLELGLELRVDLLDDLKVTRQQLADQAGRPDLKGLRQQGVAGVVEGLGGDGPRGIPVVAVLIDEDAHELGDADHRVGVVELEDDLVREGRQVRLVLARVEDADGVVQGCGDEEVLLLEAQFLTDLGGVFRVENLGDVLGLDLRGHGVHVLGAVEGEQIELVVALGGPQAQGVHAAGLVAGNHVVHRHGAHGPGRFPGLGAVGVFDDLATEGDLLITVVVGVAPRLFVGQPVIRGLNLLAVLVELLLEDAVLVLDAVAEGRHAERGEGVDEAGGQTAEAAVAEARLVFGVHDVLRLEAKGFHSLVELVGQASVQQCVLQLLAHQELGGQVADGLGVAVDGVGLGLEPGVGKVIAYGLGCGDIHVSRGGLLGGDVLSVFQLFTNLVGELFRRDGRLRCGDFGHSDFPSGISARNYYAAR